MVYFFAGSDYPPFWHRILTQLSQVFLTFVRGSLPVQVFDFPGAPLYPPLMCQVECFPVLFFGLN